MNRNKNRRGKIGRNQQCPCGSGKKYKKCHAKSAAEHVQISEEEISQKLDELKALQKQREQQQGLGNPIVSIVHQGYRFVAVGSTLYYSNKWNTFHDFLTEYLKGVFGSNWGQAEQKKDLDKQHPIIKWLKLTGGHLRGMLHRKLDLFTQLI